MVPSAKRSNSAIEQDDEQDAIGCLPRSKWARGGQGQEGQGIVDSHELHEIDAAADAASSQRVRARGWSGVGRGSSCGALRAHSLLSAAHYLDEASKLAARAEQHEAASESSHEWAASLLVDDIVDVHVDAFTRDARARARAHQMTRAWAMQTPTGFHGDVTFDEVSDSSGDVLAEWGAAQRAAGELWVPAVVRGFATGGVGRAMGRGGPIMSPGIPGAPPSRALRSDDLLLTPVGCGGSSPFAFALERTSPLLARAYHDHEPARQAASTAATAATADSAARMATATTTTAASAARPATATTTAAGAPAARMATATKPPFWTNARAGDKLELLSCVPGLPSPRWLEATVAAEQPLSAVSLLALDVSIASGTGTAPRSRDDFGVFGDMMDDDGDLAPRRRRAAADPLLHEARTLVHEAAERALWAAARATDAADSAREAAARARRTARVMAPEQPAYTDPYVLAAGGLPAPRASLQGPSSEDRFGPTAGSHAGSVPLITSGGEGHGRPTSSLVFRVYVDVDLTPLRARAAVARTIAAECPVELVGKRIWLSSTSVPPMLVAAHGAGSGGAEAARRQRRFGRMPDWGRALPPWAPWTPHHTAGDVAPSRTLPTPLPPAVEAVVRAFDEASGLHAVSCGENASACALLDLARDPATCFWLAPDDALALGASRAGTIAARGAVRASSADDGAEALLVTVAAAPRRAVGVLARLGTHLVECAVCFSRVPRRMLARTRCCPRFAICEPCARAHAAAALEVVGGGGCGAMVVPAFVRCPAPSCNEHLPLATLRERLDHATFARLLGAVRETEAAKAATALRRAAAATAAARQRQRPGTMSAATQDDGCSGGDEPLRSDDDDSAALAQLVGFAQRAGVRFCPACSMSIEKNGGCDHMRCWRCGTDFSWSDAQLLIASPASPVVAPEASSAMVPPDVPLAAAAVATAASTPQSSWELLDDATGLSLRAAEFAVGPSPPTLLPPATPTAGDGWSCLSCSNANFVFRATCNRCGRSRAAGGIGGGAIAGAASTMPPPAENLSLPDRNAGGASLLDGDGLLDELARHVFNARDHAPLPSLPSPPPTPTPNPRSVPPRAPRRPRAGQQHELIVIDD